MSRFERLGQLEEHKKHLNSFENYLKINIKEEWLRVAITQWVKDLLFEAKDIIMDSINSKLEHWLKLLQTDGINSKKQVADEIKEILGNEQNH